MIDINPNHVFMACTVLAFIGILFAIYDLEKKVNELKGDKK